MNYTKGELDVGYTDLIHEFAEIYYKPNLDKFQFITILELFLGRTAAPVMYEALKQAEQDINWMLNNQQFLNPQQFEYIEQALAKGGK